jgi:hypothetical protein
LLSRSPDTREETMAENQMTLYRQAQSRLHRPKRTPVVATVNILGDGKITMMAEGPIVVEQNIKPPPHPLEKTAEQVFCSRCGQGPQYHTIAFQEKVYCAPCGEHMMTAFKHNYRDCRAYLPEYSYWNGQIQVQDTGIHWLREHGTYLGIDSSTVLRLTFPPPKGETYVAYIRAPHKSAGMQDANSLIIDDPMDYNMWAGDYAKPAEAVVWYRVKKILLVPFTNFPLF